MMKKRTPFLPIFASLLSLALFIIITTPLLASGAEPDLRKEVEDAPHRHRMAAQPLDPDAKTPSTVQDYQEYLKTTCESYGVPYNLMRAIIEVESRYQIWSLNVEGKSYFLRTKAEALNIIAENKDKSFDVGLMQINVMWLRKFGIRAEDALEPFVNILLGVYIMNENLIAYGPTWKGVAAYHTPPGRNPLRAMTYAKKIWERYRKIEREG